MSRISQDFINDLGFLYEHIHVKDQDFLNEESEYYDEEASELVEDIISTISLSMIYEGFSANAVIGFLADSSEEEIIEKYLSFDENILTESNVSEEYIEEQLELLEDKLRAAANLGKAAFKTLFGKGPGYAATKLQGPRAPGLVDKAKVLGSKVVNKVKEVGSKAKAVLTGPNAKKVGLGSLLAGGGVLTGYLGSKMSDGGKEGTQGTGKPTPSGTPSGTKGDDFLKGSALAKLGGREGRIKDGEFRTMKWSPESRARYDAATKGAAKPTPSAPPAPAAPSSSGSGSSSSAKPAVPKKPEGGTPMQQWAKKYPELAAKVKPGQAGYDEISAMRDKPGPSEKKDQTPTTGKPEAKIDTSSVEADIKKEQERLKKKADQTPVTAKESYDAYDVILEYLIGTEQVDTLEEAHYVMMEMDAQTVGDIIEQYENYLLEEEIQEWVNDLVDEGYDLSEYTWDDMVEYYVTEARVDAGKTDEEKQESRRERGNSSFMNILSRRMKKSRGKKPLDEPGKNRYSTMQHNKKQAQRERDADEQRSRDRGGMSRGTWDKD